MADKNGPDGTGKTGRGNRHEPDIRDDDLERRRRDLEASLATRRPGRLEGKDDAKAGSVAGYGQALKLSSEFIAGVVVGAGIGWIIDRLAGTSPWGLIVFLLLGFGAGVLNVMRSAGVVAEFGQGDKSRRDQDDKK
ncbi:AtpZ/AtpI family protein [Mesorhizobium sp. M0870]|uniref:AtpZ/AtpI family protein n=1 Tax=Mesorhizobium sp. M0870 TaxID=2957016 RepID=UPI00333B5B9F